MSGIPTAQSEAFHSRMAEIIKARQEVFDRVYITHLQQMNISHQRNADERARNTEAFSQEYTSYYKALHGHE